MNDFKVLYSTRINWGFSLNPSQAFRCLCAQTLIYYSKIVLFLPFWNAFTVSLNIIAYINWLIIFRMVLMVQGVVQDEPPPDTRTLYLNHPVLRDSASQLLTISTKVIGPIGLLYVCQREMAVTVPHDSMCIIPSVLSKTIDRIR